jgi:predicted dehydrogenase
MGSRHAAHWCSAGAQVVAVADPDAARAGALASAYGAAAFDDPFEAVAQAGANAVSVCTPTVLHVPLIRAAVSAGTHVLTEKPLALRETDLEGLEAHVRETSAVVRVGFMRRFDPVWQAYLREAQALGGPLMAQASVTAGLRPKRAMHDARLNGGPVTDMACHLTELWTRLYGRMPRRVSARTETYLRGHPSLAGIEEVAPDTLLATLDFGTAGAAQLQLSWGLPPGADALESHQVVGPHGRVAASEAGVTGHGGAVTAGGGVDAYARQVHAFYRELVSGRPQGLATLTDGRRLVCLADAMLASAERGEAVDLDEEDT